jgi:hypothetical protein
MIHAPLVRGWSLEILHILHTVIEPRTNGAQDTSPGQARNERRPGYQIKKNSTPQRGVRKE